jgi:hypothetical protein
MKITEIYDGRDLGEFSKGRAFFFRAKFRDEDGSQYQGWLDGEKYRFTRVHVTANGFTKHYLVRKKSKLEKQLLEMIRSYKGPIVSWDNLSGEQS